MDKSDKAAPPLEIAGSRVTGQFFFALLNPALALLLAAIFALLWRKRPARRHLLLVSAAFLCCALAFIAQDFLGPFDGLLLRVLINGLFSAGILLACCAALVRVGAAIPVSAFAAISAAAAALFCWFNFVEPSVTARIYVLNTAFALFAVLTFWRLFRTGPRTLVDWLGFLLMGFLFALAVSRPLATLLSVLDVNADGQFEESAYWATVQAFTPLLVIATALVFLAALVAELVGELRNEADRDYLTGLLNRRGFDARAGAALAETDAALFQPAVMIVDIDNFKKINDGFGHAVGDEVIAAVAGVLSAQAHSALVGRTGGEEFALFFPDSRRGDLLALSEAIRSALARLAIPALPADYPLTVSIGIHTRHQAEPLATMMTQADRALYAAKTAGKDRAVIVPLPLRELVEHPARMTR